MGPMKTIVLFLVFIVVGLGELRSSQANQESLSRQLSSKLGARDSGKTQLVRVRLQKSLKRIEVSGYSLSFGSSSSKFKTVAIPRHQKATLTLDRVQPKPVFRLKLEGREEKLSLDHERLKISGDMLKLGPEAVPREIFLYPQASGRFDVVTSMDLETYLAGVLPSEMPVSWPLEALKAQTVAIRSYTRSLMEERKYSHFHLEASIHDQVYKLINDIGGRAEDREKVRRAIRETEGQFLTKNSGKTLKAFYHADCGGQTEEPGLVWGSGKNIGSVKDLSCPLSPLGEWSLNLEREELRQKLIAKLGLPKDTNLRGLLVRGRTPSGRVASVDVLFEGQKPMRLSSNDFRQTLGFNQMKSANFKLTWFGNELKIEGRGHGHGVGLCQWGSRALSARGLGYKEILKHYYPSAILTEEQRPQALSSI